MSEKGQKQTAKGMDKLSARTSHEALVLLLGRSNLGV